MTHGGLSVRMAVLAAAFGILVPAQLLALRAGSPLAGRIPVLLHRLFLRLFGIRVSVVGEPPPPGRPVLILANHVSWLDIPVMASLCPLSFVAKQEIAGWPLFGAASRLQRSIFLDRTRKAATGTANAEMAGRLARGETILLFPEGTTGDGNRILPFRSSLVGAARAALDATGGAPIVLQPLAITYTRRDGLPLTRRDRPAIAWYGDMELAPHAVAFVRGGVLDVTVTWAAPIPFGPGHDRKKAAAAAEIAVRAAVQAAGGEHAGRPTAGRASDGIRPREAAILSGASNAYEERRPESGPGRGNP